MGLALTIMMAACAPSTGDAWERIHEAGILRIGIDPTYPPFALDDGGTLSGIDVDLGRALAVELGLEPQFTYLGYDGLYDALTTGQVDVLISALVIAPERTKEIAYTAPYFDAGLFLVMPVGANPATGMDGLGGTSVAVELGTLGHVQALEWQRHLANLTIQTYGSVDEALGSVSRGQNGTALVDYVSARLYIRNNPVEGTGLTYSSDSIVSEPYAMAVRIEDRTLLAHLNDALIRLEKSGRLPQIIETNLGP
ncbi:MAG: amino acid ABC transporter substrate-binding protein [Anaerolineales bacterium]|uniref:substrate-binding periplasmic protein n=1 Tax=Promineifilum sp. TaxID=2664178 RepID=UPI001E17FC8F|nr:amino acid ABC transporter substrate-binding protein [Anaerolineales bacterium]MCO5178624.1 ABC transporter substrate-binding protein [Promineifilum sp.]